MNQGTETLSSSAQTAPSSIGAGIAGWWDSRRACAVHQIMRDVSQVAESLNADPGLMAQMAAFNGVTLVLSATDTGRALMIVFGSNGVSTRPYAGEPCDVKIEASEDVHWAILSGQMDADAAFFSRKVRIRGSIVTAFSLKNKFLSLLQSHLANTCQVGGGSTSSR